MATVDERLDALDQREAIDNTMQNEALHDLWDALNDHIDATGPGRNPYLSREFLITAALGIGGFLTGLAGVIPGELGVSIATVAGIAYTVARTLQKRGGA
jgi:hypothetical protein